ncbi:MAG: hypothetical protein IKW74_03035, partial [Thermoguttaceae bacterium]|nr:hypothetical protein [Thermoguttaceae bacterium]
DSESSSQVINLVDEDPNSLFMSESDDNSGAYGTSEETTDAGFSAPGSGMESAFDFGGTTEATDSTSPFGGFSDMGTEGTEESASGSIDFTSIGDGDITGTQTLPVTSGCSYAAGKGCLQEPNFTGMSIGLGLVPCIVLLILAGIGAYELIRSIWSWEQPFGLSGAVLEMFGGLFKLF